MTEEKSRTFSLSNWHSPDRITARLSPRDEVRATPDMWFWSARELPIHRNDIDVAAFVSDDQTEAEPHEETHAFSDWPEDGAGISRSRTS